MPSALQLSDRESHHLDFARYMIETPSEREGIFGDARLKFQHVTPETHDLVIVTFTEAGHYAYLVGVIEKGVNPVPDDHDAVPRILYVYDPEGRAEKRVRSVQCLFLSRHNGETLEGCWVSVSS